MNKATFAFDTRWRDVWRFTSSSQIQASVFSGGKGSSVELTIDVYRMLKHSNVKPQQHQ
jgi:hypothetical protein